MTTLVKFLVTAFLALLLTSCHFDLNFGQENGNGNVIEQDLNISESFKDVHAAAGWDVTLQKGNSTAVTAKMDENLLDILEVYVSGNTLEIKTKNNHNIGSATSKKVLVTYVGELENISASSGADIFVNDKLEGERLRFDVSSGGSISANAMVRNIKAEVSSGGNIKLSGGAET
ncbi:MAG: DUF2807 domain-containing protein, partial [Leeuwenhoekiella sp.]